MDEKISMMLTLQMRTASPFKDLFPIREDVLNEIVSDMKENGFDFSHPIVVWAGHKVTVVDGHTRLAAALKVGMSKVPITLKEFADETAALKYAIKSQRNRRNLTDPELLKCVEELDKRMKEGRPEKTATRVAVNGRSSENTAKLLGTSRGKVEKIRTINDHASDEVKEAVKSGEMSVNKAFRQTMAARREEESGTRDKAELKAARQSALENSICGSIEARIDREVQEYSAIRYTAEEVDRMKQTIISKLNSEFSKITEQEEN